MTEAYNVLSDRAARRLSLAVEGQVGWLRARSRRLDADERQVANPFARIYLRSGRRKYGSAISTAHGSTASWASRSRTAAQPPSTSSG
jgi:curved DNA-binding protein CbpA